VDHREVEGWFVPVSPQRPRCLNAEADDILAIHKHVSTIDNSRDRLDIFMGELCQVFCSASRVKRKKALRKDTTGPPLPAQNKGLW